MATTLLIVDDDPVVRRVVGAHLRQHGYDVAAAAGVDEALLSLSARHAQIVITDLEMPGRDGYELLRLLRDQHPLVRTIVLTGHDEVSTVLEVLKLGAFSFVAKPIADPGALVQAVAQAEDVVRSWLDRLAKLSRRRRPPSGSGAFQPTPEIPPG